MTLGHEKPRESYFKLRCSRPSSLSVSQSPTQCPSRLGPDPASTDLLDLFDTLEPAAEPAAGC